MSQLRRIILCACLAAALGCRTAPPVRTASAPPSQSSAKVSRTVPAEQNVAKDGTNAPLRPVSHQEQLPAPSPPLVIVEGVPANLDGELQLESFVAAVESRHPSLQAMVAAWQAAAQRYPQEMALDDPMFMAMTAPGTWDSPLTETAYVLELRQKFPWFGERRARGWAAQQEAAAAWHDVDDARLKLSLIAQTAFFDYYLAHRQLNLNEQNIELMRQYRETAQTKYRNNQVTQQDVLQADLDLAELDRRALELQRMVRVAKARINTLLLQFPEAPLPPPAQLEVRLTDEDPALLQHLAITQRPDLAALAHQIEVEQAKLTLAYKQYHPDVELFGRYDTFWQPASTQSELRGQVGVSMNLPVYRHKLNAAVREAEFRVGQRRAEYEQRIADIRYEVQSAYEQVEESRRVVELYSSKLVSVAEQNVAAARANYEVNKSTFLDLAQAQRQLVMAREQHQEAIVTLHRRLAELRSAIGGP